MRSIIIMVALITSLLSCQDSNKKAEPNKNSEQSTTNEVYQIDKDELSKDFRTWYSYTYNNIRLATEFIGLDRDSNKIEKGKFLKQLASGKFIVYKIAKQKNVPVYKLYSLNNQDADIKSTIRGLATTAIALASMEGKELPVYDFVDLNGKKYSKNTTLGNVLVVKCWFIRCTACVEEFPDLNKLVKHYADKSDVQFVSLASDSKRDLQDFLNKKSFSYAVVADMDDFMTNMLRVNAYPLHLLVSRQGKIIKATNSIYDLLPFLKIEMSKS
jgi:thiol-disulfide isomerase/thioredoxin